MGKWDDTRKNAEKEENEVQMDRDPQSKIMTLEQALKWREALRVSGKTLTVTNGCFDLLHRGHAEYLLKAASLANKLLLLVNSDASVRALKGPSRPVNGEADRAYLLACLSFVDAVVIFDGKRCTRELETLTPNVYAKGGDYTLDSLDEEERAALLAAKSRIVFIPFVPGYSTTQTLEKAGISAIPTSAKA